MNNNIFSIENNRLTVKTTGKPVPEDEPVFILLASDRRALCAIVAYQNLETPGTRHWQVIQDIIKEFRQYCRENPEAMKSSPEAYL